ncbi:MAG: YncE family protein, partial [Thermoplasmata archaeon]
REKGELFVTDGNNVSVVNDSTNTVESTISIGNGPAGLAYDDAKGEIFVSRSNCPLYYPCGEGSVSVISDRTDKVVATVPVVVGTPGAVAYDSGKGEIYVADSGIPVNIEGDRGSANLTVINDTSNKVVTSIPLNGSIAAGGIPGDIVYDPGKGELFVTALGGPTGYQEIVDVINDTTNGVAAPIVPGESGLNLDYPGEAAYDAAQGEIWIAQSVEDSVAAINDTTDQVVASVSVGCPYPYSGSGPCAYVLGVAYDDANGLVFVADSYTLATNVTVVSSTTNGVVGNVVVGANSNLLVYDSGQNEVFGTTLGGVVVISG